MPYRLLDFSDAHLRNRRGDEQFALAQVVDAAIAHKVDAVVCAGDSIDKQSNRAAAITAWYLQLDRLEAAGIPFLYVEGQHEQDVPPWLSGHRHAVFLHRQVVEVGPFQISGITFQPFGKLQEELALVPDYVNFLVMHQVWGNWMGDIAAPQGEFAQVPGQVRWLHTGDFHEWRLEKHTNAGGEDMVVLSTGATTQQKIDEPAEHFYALINDEGRVTKKKLRSRVFFESETMLSTEQLDAFVDSLEERIAILQQEAAAMDLPEEVAKPLVRVKFSATLGDVPQRLEKLAKGRLLLAYKELPPEERMETAEPSKSKAKEAVTPLSLLHEELDKKAQPAEYELVTRLLQAQDQGMEFAKWRQEYLNEDEAET